jgi:MinD superfamily P-loop ATPase
LNQITVLSGKGGTGKTTITASLAALSANAVFADCDVDASNLHLLLNPEIKKKIEFKGLKLAVINEEKCIRCNICEAECRFKAIKNYTVDPIRCEGCNLCVKICPVNAIDFVDRICGYAYISKTRYGPMSHARLNPGMENSGKLVTLVRQNAKMLAEEGDRELVLIDGPPGIGCPVIASLSEINEGLVVVEPTATGIHDLKRALQLLAHFKVEPLVCINKYDLNEENSKAVEKLCASNEIEVLGLIPFDSNVTRAMVQGHPVVDYDPDSPASKALKNLWEKMKTSVLP